MTWILAIDGTGHAAGVVRFGRWLSGAAEHGGAPTLVPVRVLHAEHLRFVLRYEHLDEVLSRERDALAEAARALPPGRSAPLEVVLARTVAEGLEAARRRHGAAGIVVPRTPGAGRGHLPGIRGPARALLRRHASPVIVLPPDLDARDPGAGPVVALSTLSAESVPACRLARAVADGARRDLTILHAAPERRGGGRRGSAPSAMGAFARPERALARWVARHGVWPDLTAVVLGDLPAAAGYAEARRAALLAIGARPGVGVRDTFAPKPWRWLAAHATSPVLVVPATEATAGHDVPGEGPHPWSGASTGPPGRGLVVGE